MKIPFHFYFTILALIILINCGGEVPKTATTNKQVIAVIYCDLTTSVDSLSIRKVALDAQTLLLKFPPGSVLYFYRIDHTPFVNPILKFKKPMQGRTSSEIAKNRMVARKAAVGIHDNILQLYKDINADPRNNTVARSCIIRCLETAHGLFSQYRSIPGSDFDFELIFLSDMLEECQDSPAGDIFLHRQYYDEMIQRISNYQPGFDLSYANVSIIISLEFTTGQSRYFNAEQLKTFWKTVFSKVGFTDDQFYRLNFSTEIPPRFDM